MSWLVLPAETVKVLLGHPRERAWLGALLPDELDGAFVAATGEGGVFGRVMQVADSARVLALWSGEAPKSIRVRGKPIVSIWSEDNRSTIWSLAPEARSEALERIGQLAERAWANHPFPEHWVTKKIEGFQSVFAGDRTLLDLRLAYGVRRVHDALVVDIGTVYMSRRQQKRVDVPLLGDALVEALPDAIVPPDATEFPAGTQPRAGRDGADDRDLRIEMPSGESRNLFSTRYPDWMSDHGPITKQQRRVIAHQVKRPLRIHGPAGSGKTLVLILKCLKLLRDAQDQKRRCHVLLVLHSTEMRSTVRAAIEAIDDRALLAATREDPQFFDVETLHGWCIRELGLEHGPKYVLESDPTASRARQRALLEEALDVAIEEEYKQFKSIVSRDLAAWVEGDRNRLLRGLQYEIAIRIKGRGFRRRDRDGYVNNALNSFVGRGENRYDRQFLFRVYSIYEERFEREGLLDTDDVVLSMAARLGTSLWDRQRKDLGYDYVMVDETHLFNENERRVLPLLCRDTSTLLPIVMTWDEAQSIGGRRSLGLEQVGIEHSEKRMLTFVHRSCPAIFALARDLVERGPLVFSEFETSEPLAAMSAKEAKRCAKPQLVYGKGEDGVLTQVMAACHDLKAHFSRIAVITFDVSLKTRVLDRASSMTGAVYHVRERGELIGAIPRPGVYVMLPEACGGLEFDGVIVAGVDEGLVPMPTGDLGPEGCLYLEELAYTELYTAVTRAKYRLLFICDALRGSSHILREPLSAGLIDEST